MVKNSDTHNEELLFRERRKANEKLEELENPKEFFFLFFFYFFFFFIFSENLI